MKIDLRFTEEMINELKALKGKTLKSYDHYPWPKEGSNLGFMRLNFAKFAIDLESDFVPITVTGYNGEPFADESTCYMCKRVKVGESHVIPKTWKMRRYLVGETVSEVMVVRDTVTESNGDVFLLDEAIVLKTEESTITISKGCEVDTSLYIRIGDKIDVTYPLSSVRSNYSEKESGLKAKVSRDFIFL